MLDAAAGHTRVQALMAHQPRVAAPAASTASSALFLLRPAQVGQATGHAPLPHLLERGTEH